MSYCLDKPILLQRIWDHCLDDWYSSIIFLWNLKFSLHHPALGDSMGEKTRNPRHWESGLFLRRTAIRIDVRDSTLVACLSFLILGQFSIIIVCYQNQKAVVTPFPLEIAARMIADIYRYCYHWHSYPTHLFLHFRTLCFLPGPFNNSKNCTMSLLIPLKKVLQQCICRPPRLWIRR